MLSEILKKEDCAACRFCCSLRRASLWESPIFTRENIDAIEADSERDASCLIPDTTGDGDYARYDLSGAYKTDDPEEEAPCPYLSATGCILSDEEKPWDCKIWPLRVMKKDDELVIALTPTCPTINGIDFEKVRALVNDKLRDGLLDYAREHEFLVKDYREDYPIID